MRIVDVLFSALFIFDCLAGVPCKHILACLCQKQRPRGQFKWFITFCRSTAYEFKSENSTNLNSTDRTYVCSTVYFALEVETKHSSEEAECDKCVHDVTATCITERWIYELRHTQHVQVIIHLNQNGFD